MILRLSFTVTRVQPRRCNLISRHGQKLRRSRAVYLIRGELVAYGAEMVNRLLSLEKKIK